MKNLFFANLFRIKSRALHATRHFCQFLHYVIIASWLIRSWILACLIFKLKSRVILRCQNARIGHLVSKLKSCAKEEVNKLLKCFCFQKRVMSWYTGVIMSHELICISQSRHMYKLKDICHLRPFHFAIESWAQTQMPNCVS